MTKAQERIYNNYRQATATSLYDVYTTFSQAKAKAFDDCINDMMKHNGAYMRILSANSFQFTCAYTYGVFNGKGLEIHLVYHTASRREEFIINTYER